MTMLLTRTETPAPEMPALPVETRFSVPTSYRSVLTLRWVERWAQAQPGDAVVGVAEFSDTCPLAHVAYEFLGYDGWDTGEGPEVAVEDGTIRVGDRVLLTDFGVASVYTLVDRLAPIDGDDDDRTRVTARDFLGCLRAYRKQVGR